MNDSILNFLTNHRINKNARFLIAVSGGIDSTVLSHIFHELQLAFGIAHCNFQLRQEESDEDARFVEELAQTFGVPIHKEVLNTSIYSQEKGISTQMAARELRYDFFSRVMEEEAYDFLVTAHHHDDSAETLLFNLFKGTGIQGLTGILPVRGNIIRPMIHLTREDILNYAKQHNIKWREDSSNISNAYQRNLIRNEILPHILKINPSFSNTLLNTMERMQSAADVFEAEVSKLIDENLHKKGDDFSISKSLFSFSNNAPVLHLWLKEYGFNYEQCKQISMSLNHGSGKQFFSSTYTITLDREDLILSATSEPDQEESCTISEKDKEVRFQGIKLEFLQKNGDRELPSDHSVAMLDLSKLTFPLELKHWKPGDFFIPLGMKGKKKISDFMIDQKIPLNLKNRVLLLCSDNNVVWVVGHRIDDRYKVTGETREIIQVKFTDHV